MQIRALTKFRQLLQFQFLNCHWTPNESVDLSKFLIYFLLLVAPAPSCQWERKSVSYEAFPTLVKDTESPIDELKRGSNKFAYSCPS